MTEYETFIRAESVRRGIDPDVAVTVAKREGGVTEPSRRGTFDTGSSWWAFQLHYGGRGYEQLGTVAGMGNSFTALTGWAPGDPKAWRDAARYALDAVKRSGWGPWYGAAAAGIRGFDGVVRDFPWTGTPDSEWDYRTMSTSPVPPPRVTYNPAEPPHPQDAAWDCAQESLEWALWSVGRRPTDGWLTDTMLAESVISRERGLLDATGEGLAAFAARHYGEFGYTASADALVSSFDDVARESGRYPLLVGGRRWGNGGHWSGVRGYDRDRDVLLLANPAEGWQGVGQTLDRRQWEQFWPWALVRLSHPDLLVPAPAPAPPAPPAPDPRDARIADLERQLVEARTALGVLTVNYPADLAGLIDGLRNIERAMRALKPG